MIGHSVCLQCHLMRTSSTSPKPHPALETVSDPLSSVALPEGREQKENSQRWTGGAGSYFWPAQPHQMTYGDHEKLKLLRNTCVISPFHTTCLRPVGNNAAWCETTRTLRYTVCREVSKILARAKWDATAVSDVPLHRVRPSVAPGEPCVQTVAV